MIDDETIRHRRKVILTFFFTYRENPIDSNYFIDFFYVKAVFHLLQVSQFNLGEIRKF